MSTPHYHAVVIGGGPAGSSAAIHLALSGRRVLLVEKAEMPRDTLCGEFLSPEVSAMCGRLGVLEAMQHRGARTVRRFHLTEPGGRVHHGQLPGAALCLSRQTFDHVLFERAAAVGAEAREGEAVLSVKGRPEGFEVETRSGSVTAAVVLGAFGRRTLLDRRLQRPFLKRRSPFVGFKARCEGPYDDEGIELHTFEGGYCGLIADENDLVNVCWLAREDQLRSGGGSPEGMIDHVLTRNPHLQRRFELMTRVTDFMAVGQLTFREKALFASGVCMIGDAAGMIAPLCGDGIAMALRSAELVAPLVGRCAAGDISMETFRVRYTTAWRGEFSARMRLGRYLNAALIRPASCSLAVRLANIAPGAARKIVAATRG